MHDDHAQEEQPAAETQRETIVTTKNDDKDPTARKGQKDEEIRALIEERRTTDKKYKERLKNISEKIKKRIRDNKKAKRQNKIQHILEEF